MIDAAIVGLGWWGKNLVNAVQGKSERLRFIRGVSKEPDSVREFASRHGFDLSTELSEVLADPKVKAVVLATPHSLHVDQVVAAARSGKPVFCEKPLALNRAGAVRAIEACAEARVPLGLGANKRLWSSMRELRKVVASGVLGEILHVEGHYSNENSGTLFSSWRDSPAESPGGGMTGSGLHVLDALVNVGGPIRRVDVRLMLRKPSPDPLDTVSGLVEFKSRVTGMFGTVRASPFYWRVHVFGRKGSVEAVGETDLVLRHSGGKVERSSFEPVDTLRAELDRFADAAAGVAPFYIPTAEMLNTVTAFEAVIKSIDTGAPVTLD
ncbi:MAG TPA: Gfo/Idh/MocA family oxidoreductase [Alphaproteobacteria bacterium]